jgi:GT2 family glycosyltransferase
VLPTDLSVATVVLHHRHQDDTVRCVRALRRSTHRDQRIIVVHNEATPEADAALREALGPVTLITSAENLGYAGGNNLGLRYGLDLGVDALWLLNPDTIVEPTTLERMLATAVARPDAGLIGALARYHRRKPPTVWCNGGVIDWSRGGATWHLDDGRPVSQARTEGPFPVDYVTGACMLVRREVLTDVGLLPEHYFLYFEETHFATDVRNAGWAILQEPRAQLDHDKRSTGRLPAPYYVYYFVRNRLRFATGVGGCDLATVEADLDGWISAWRTKITDREPSWLPAYERLVAAGLEDGRADRRGRRDDLDALVAGAVIRG